MPLCYEDGLWWPVGDTQCRKPTTENVRDLDLALKYVNYRFTCVQAGGNCGVWPSYLASKFREVWTIEADLTNYRCLLKNTAGMPAIRPIWAALADRSGMHVGFKREEGNIGAHHIDKGSMPEIVTLAIDDLDLGGCDFIQLDIEGMEHHALTGAKGTIERFKPILMVENNGSCEKFGTPKDWTENFPGYRVVCRVHRDVILAPC